MVEKGDFHYDFEIPRLNKLISRVRKERIFLTQLILSISSSVTKFLQSFLIHLFHFGLKLLTPKSDQERISPYNINTISSRKGMGIKRNISIEGLLRYLIQYQIHQSNIIRIEWQTVRRITNEILGVKWVNELKLKFLMIEQIQLSHNSLLAQISYAELSV